MSTTAPKPATTPIPVQLSAPEFEAFLLLHLSMPKRDPKCKLGYHRFLTLSCGCSTRGCNGSVCPSPPMPKASPPSTTPPSIAPSLHGRMMGRSGRRSWLVWDILRTQSISTFASSMAMGPTPWLKKGRWHRVLGLQTPERRESQRHDRQPWLCTGSPPRSPRQ
jgi:hypothetical protein